MSQIASTPTKKHKRSSSYDIEIHRKKLGVIAFSIIGGTTCLAFGWLTPSQDSWWLRGALVFNALYLYAIAFSLRYHDKYNVCFDLCGYGITPTILIIVASGGYENTGLLWVYPFLISLFMFLGHVKGLIVNSILFLAIAYLCTHQELIDATYQDSEVSRFMASYAVSIFLCFSMEFFRLRSFNRLASISSNRNRLANTDALTGLPNRRFIDSEFLPTAEKLPESYFPLAAVLIDIDHFKQVNDTHGHQVGDAVLKFIAQQFKASVRETDLIGRIGGEEFLLLIPRASLSTGVAIAEKIKDSIQRSVFKEGHLEVQVTISAGVSPAEDIGHVEEAISNADALMYQAKNKGRNRVEYQQAV